MDYFPLFMDIKNKSCLVVGGGEIAFRKANALLRAGACVSIAAPEFSDEVLELKHQEKCELIRECFNPSHLLNKVLVIAATNDRSVNKQVYQSAKDASIPVNVVDNPDLCTFIFPAIVERGPMTIAVCSNGNAPVLGRLLRAKIESIIPFQYGKLAELAQKYRAKVKSVFSNTNQRRDFWESVFEGKIAHTIFEGKFERAEALLQQKLAARSFAQETRGEVYLVGAGPGDPELLTFKALRLMQQADVVIYDRLVTPEILDLTRRDAQKIYVGKKSKFHCVPQSDINKLLLEYAEKGHRVLRLKGGDPFIFGRGGEEAEELVKRNIPFQVVPGITSAAGASTYCGIPLTHRDYAHSVTFVTGHLKNDTCDLNWKALAQPGQTLVIYMGLSGLKTIARELTSHGLPGETPVALIQNATRTNQKIAIGNLETIERVSRQKNIISPALIVVGEVINLHETLSQENRSQPLAEAHGNLALERTA
ncbi:siroheme synthase CysG [Aliikangiella sp. G2MR2-5]|uniref:siroheme synthase CysG n=1 Tax=Aliikangiella sp. G2MR2-5 TaxID=2788943 RepID=UPI0018ABAE1C|nr:siroheme synthase CysG [Aliikangiella sp. G2MR2-5]